MDILRALFDLSNGYLVIDTFPTQLECIEAQDYYIESVRRFLHCAQAVMA